MKITDALVAEHAIFLRVFDQIERALPSLTSPNELRTVARIVESVLQDHAAQETNLAYLALDHVQADRGEMERMYQDHHEIDDRLKKVHTTKNFPEGQRLLQATLNASREHFLLEERVLFPLLEKALSPETLQELGRSWLQRKSEGAVSN